MLNLPTRSLPFSVVRRLRSIFPAIASQKAKLSSGQSPPHGLGAHEVGTEVGALFIAPDGAGSLGDSAMIQAGIAQLRQQGLEQFGVVYPQYGADTPDWGHIPGLSTHLGLRYKPEDYLHEVRLALGRYWNGLEQFAQLARQYGRVYCVGADVMDGYYSLEICQFLTGLLGLAAAAGAQTTLVGFSFNKTPKPEAVKWLRQLPASVRLCARDPLSQQRAEGCLDRPIELVADAAFLLQPTVSNSQVQRLLDWIAAERSQNRMLIGININAMLLRAVEGLTVDQLVAHYSQTLQQLFEQNAQDLEGRIDGLSFVMLPHDNRDEVHDLLLSQLTLAQLPETIRDRCSLLMLPCAPGDVKRICQDLDLVSTSRMHVAIAALGQGTPTLSIGYQDKHEGLYQHFNVPELLMSPAQALKPEGLLHFIQHHLLQQQQLHQHLEQRLPHVMELSQKNFSA